MKTFLMNNPWTNFLISLICRLFSAASSDSIRFHSNLLSQDNDLRVSIDNTCTDSLVTALDDEALLINDYMNDMSKSKVSANNKKCIKGINTTPYGARMGFEGPFECAWVDVTYKLNGLLSEQQQVPGKCRWKLPANFPQNKYFVFMMILDFWRRRTEKLIMNNNSVWIIWKSIVLSSSSIDWNSRPIPGCFQFITYFLLYALTVT